MSMKRTDLQRFLLTLLRPGTFYILGAGASAGIVPFTAATLTFVRQRYAGIGIYPATDSTPSPLWDRVVLEPMLRRWKRGEGCPDDLLLKTIPQSTLELLAQLAWSPPLGSTAPPQYSLLQRIASPAVFFTFNLDGLARSYLHAQHLVLEPHGTGDRCLTESPEFEEFLELSLDIRFPFVTPKHLPGPEPAQITNSVPYVRARTYLRNAPAVVIIGYSFGRFRGKMDDSESFEYLLDGLARQHSPVFVLDPDAESIASAIEERLRCHRVTPLAVKWDVLSTALLTMTGRHDSISTLCARHHLDAVISAYNQCLDKSG